jgi:hypothetical protein
LIADALLELEVGTADGGTEFSCLTDGRTACTAGFTSSVHVLDRASKSSMRFGTFVHRPLPRVTITEQEVSVTAGDCTQTARRPWD